MNKSSFDFATSSATSYVSLERQISFISEMSTFVVVVFIVKNGRAMREEKRKK